METLKKHIAKLPHHPGIYFFYDTNGVILYVGKAKDLKKRVTQYFSRDDAIGAKTKLLVSQIARIETQETVSEFDALMLEAARIYELQPKYNILAKDDKSPVYLTITKEELPRLLVTRKPKSTIYDLSSTIYFGPFQSSRMLRSILRSIRRIVPYCTSKTRRGKPCFYTHIGLCDPCPCVIAGMPAGESREKLVRAYRANVTKIRLLFAGRSRDVFVALEKEMRERADAQEFEKAHQTKIALENLTRLLTRHYDPHIYIQTDITATELYEQELESLRTILAPYYPTITKLHRIECIDISNLLGSQATGSLVVLTGGKPDTSEYRRFRMRGRGPNDVAMIAEVIKRRMGHADWPMPDLLIVDGGKPQVQSAKTTFAALDVAIPLIGLAKRYEQFIIPTDAGWKTLTIPRANPALHVAQRIRDEAHRFALTYHRLLRKKASV